MTIKSNISNKNVDERFTELVQGLSYDTFLQDMEKLRQLDPYLYNNIVATFGELKAIRDEVELTFSRGIQSYRNR